MEYVDILDSHGKKTGKTTTRNRAHALGLWHACAHILIFSQGKFLMQRRARGIRVNPGKWDISSAGHVAAGDTPKRAAVRELHEELGLRVSSRQLHVLDKFFVDGVLGTDLDIKEVYHVYALKISLQVNDLVLQKEEVDDAKFFSKQELRIELKRHPDQFVDHGKYWDFILKQPWTK